MRRHDFLPVFTVGHSVLGEGHFAGILQRQNIDLVLDVRSSPYSRRAPQFNRRRIEHWLEVAGIRYSFGGRTLGGRPDDPSLYDAGQVSYARMAKTESFLSSLRRVAIAARSSRVALMCAEADPIECHRFLLIGRVLNDKAFDVRHILSNGEVESHAHAEQRLLAAVGLLQPDIFDQRNGALSAAYSIQASRVAYVLPHRTTNLNSLDYL